MIGVMSGTRPNVFAERFSRQRDGLRAEPVVRAAGGELLGGTLYEHGPGPDPRPVRPAQGGRGPGRPPESAVQARRRRGALARPPTIGGPLRCVAGPR